MAELTHVPANEVKRSIDLLPALTEQLEAATAKLRSIEHISEVRIDDSNRLRVQYDASSVGFGDIECLLDEAGLPRVDNAWLRFKYACYRFFDSNARANALSKGGACCNRPPSGWSPDRDSNHEQ